MADAIGYFSLFLTTTKEIPAENSWKLWLPLFSDFWRTWGNSPAWEVDLLKLYSRLAFHRASEVIVQVVNFTQSPSLAGELGTPHARPVHEVHEQLQPAGDLWWIWGSHQAGDQGGHHMRHRL